MAKADPSCGGFGVDAVEELDPEDGDGLVVSGGFGVLAAYGLVVATDAEAHAVEGGGFAELMDVAGAGEEMGCVGPAVFGERAGFEGVEECVSFGLGGWQ